MKCVKKSASECGGTCEELSLKKDFRDKVKLVGILYFGGGKEWIDGWIVWVVCSDGGRWWRWLTWASAQIGEWDAKVQVQQQQTIWSFLVFSPISRSTLCFDCCLLSCSLFQREGVQLLSSMSTLSLLWVIMFSCSLCKRYDANGSCVLLLNETNDHSTVATMARRSLSCAFSGKSSHKEGERLCRSLDICTSSLLPTCLPSHQHLPLIWFT